jgi:hypothetical protein
VIYSMWLKLDWATFWAIFSQTYLVTLNRRDWKKFNRMRKSAWRSAKVFSKPFDKLQVFLQMNH